MFWSVIFAGRPVLEIWKWCFGPRLSKGRWNRLWWASGPHHSCSVCASVPEEERGSLLFQERWWTAAFNCTVLFFYFFTFSVKQKEELYLINTDHAKWSEWTHTFWNCLLTMSCRGTGPEIFIPVWHQSNMWQESPVCPLHYPNGSTSRYSKNYTGQEIFLSCVT